MSGDLYAPRRGNRGLWAAVSACAVLNVVTLSLLVLAFSGRAPLPAFDEGAMESRHGRNLLGRQLLTTLTGVNNIPALCVRINDNFGTPGLGGIEFTCPVRFNPDTVITNTAGGAGGAPQTATIVAPATGSSMAAVSIVRGNLIAGRSLDITSNAAATASPLVSISAVNGAGAAVGITGDNNVAALTVSSGANGVRGISVTQGGVAVGQDGIAVTGTSTITGAVAGGVALTVTAGSNTANALVVDTTAGSTTAALSVRNQQAAQIAIEVTEGTTVLAKQLTVQNNGIDVTGASTLRNNNPGVTALTVLNQDNANTAIALNVDGRTTMSRNVGGQDALTVTNTQDVAGSRALVVTGAGARTALDVTAGRVESAGRLTIDTEGLTVTAGGANINGATSITHNQANAVALSVQNDNTNIGSQALLVTGHPSQTASLQVGAGPSLLGRTSVINNVANTVALTVSNTDSTTAASKAVSITGNAAQTASVEVLAGTTNLLRTAINGATTITHDVAGATALTVRNNDNTNVNSKAVSIGGNAAQTVSVEVTAGATTLGKTTIAHTANGAALTVDNPSNEANAVAISTFSTGGNAGGGIRSARKITVAAGGIDVTGASTITHNLGGGATALTLNNDVVGGLALKVTAGVSSLSNTVVAGASGSTSAALFVTGTTNSDVPAVEVKGAGAGSSKAAITVYSTENQPTWPAIAVTRGTTALGATTVDGGVGGATTLNALTVAGVTGKHALKVDAATNSTTAAITVAAGTTADLGMHITKGGLTVAGTTTLTTVKNDTLLSGDWTVTGKITVGSTGSTINGLTVFGTSGLAVSGGATTLTSLAVTGATALNATAGVTGLPAQPLPTTLNLASLTVTGSASINNATLSGTGSGYLAALPANANFTNLSVTNLAVSGTTTGVTATLPANANFTNLVVSGKVATKDLDVTGTATGNFFTLPASATFTSLNVTGKTTTKDLDVTGKATGITTDVPKDLVVDSVTALKVTAAIANVTGALNAGSAVVATSVSASSATLTGALTAGAATVGDLTVSGKATGSFPATIPEDLSIKNLVVSGKTVLGTTEDAEGILEVRGQTQFRGLVKNTRGYRATGSIECNSAVVNFGLTVGSTTQQGALVVNGLNTAGLTVFGKTTISKTLAVGQTCTCSNVTPPTAAGPPQSRKLL